MMPLRTQAFHSGGLFSPSALSSRFCFCFLSFSPDTHSLFSSLYNMMRPYVIIAAAAALLPAMVSAQGAPPTWCVPNATPSLSLANKQLTSLR
jgi:hypothetical protein